MPALGNLDYERFCQAAHTRIWAGEKRADALVAAYRETVYRGENTDDEALKPNSRRLANRKEIAARLKELADYSARLAGIDAHWAMLKLKGLVDDVDAFTIDDYMARDEAGVRLNECDLTNVTADQMRRLKEVRPEVTITRAEDGTETIRRKISIVGPDRYSIVPTVVGLMAKLAGWEAPKKIAPTNPAGDQPWSLERLIGASMASKETEKAA